MEQESFRPNPAALAIQARIDNDPAYRARFLADPLGAAAAAGIPTGDLRLAGSDDTPGGDGVTGHTIRIGHWLCYCLIHDANGVCVIEQCLL